jgi:transposase
MMEIKETIGVDVSKSTLDAHLHRKNASNKFDNSQKGYRELLKWAKQVTTLKIEDLLFCFEHTGIYSLPLSAFLMEKKVRFAMVPALEIKKSIGMVRGKSDIIDAKRIAEYAHLRREIIKTTILPSVTLRNMKQLLSLRERMVSQRAGYYSYLKETKEFLKKSENTELFKVQETMIEQLSKNILILERKISGLIKADPQLEEMYNLITSVKGIGPIIAANLLVVTNCFSGFENSRQMSCYCGIAPFETQSGTSLKNRPRVSHYANKKMKTLLNLAASNAIQYDAELKIYYERRVEQGKSKMSTLNIIRNKIIHRVFAVAKRKTPYVNTAKWAA